MGESVQIPSDTSALASRETNADDSQHSPSQDNNEGSNTYEESAKIVIVVTTPEIENN